jgi:murein tripeptide amidase MpaA
MMNCDGVVIGNSRASIIGLDLNRRWTDPNAVLHPEIYAIKKLMQR